MPLVILRRKFDFGRCEMMHYLGYENMNPFRGGPPSVVKICRMCPKEISSTVWPFGMIPMETSHERDFLLGPAKAGLRFDNQAGFPTAATALKRQETDTNSEPSKPASKPAGRQAGKRASKLERQIVLPCKLRFCSDKQGSLHHTPEHCLVNGGVPSFWYGKAMFQLVAKCIF